MLNHATIQRLLIANFPSSVQVFRLPKGIFTFATIQLICFAGLTLPLFTFLLLQALSFFHGSPHKMPKISFTLVICASSDSLIRRTIYLFIFLVVHGILKIHNRSMPFPSCFFIVSFIKSHRNLQFIILFTLFFNFPCKCCQISSAVCYKCDVVSISEVVVSYLTFTILVIPELTMKSK